METGFIMGVFTSYWFLLALFSAALIAEYNDQYIVTSIFVVITLAILTLAFGAPLWVFLGYIPAGVAWSVWRWRVHCKKCTNLAKEGKLNRVSGSWREYGDVDTEKSRKYLMQATDLKSNVDRIVAWIICFPISMIESAISDFIHIMKVFVTEWFAKVYNSSSKKALKDFDSK